VSTVLLPNRPRPPLGATSSEPVRFLGVEHRAAKKHFAGTHRTCEPEITLERVRPLLAEVGITRIADITGLDRIGVPTALAMRPNAPTVANSSGKGLTRCGATVSAAMEGIELYFGEEFRPGSRGEGHGEGLHVTFRDLERAGLACPEENLPLTRCSLFNPHLPEDWVVGFDLIEQRPLSVPFASVSVMPAYWRDWQRSSFQAGSNGLASGNVFLEAVVAGLLEVIERDAVTCSRLRTGGRLELAPRVDLRSSGYPSVDELVERLERAGTTPYLFDCTVDTAVPTYVAYLADNLDPATGAFRGYGTHLGSEVAVLRALTEAVEGRAVYIAGSRDDLTSLEHEHMRSHRQLRLDMLEEPGPERAPLPPSSACGTFEEDCALLLEKLRAAGLGHAVVVDLAPSGYPVSVVRVVVPGLEGYSPLPNWAPGPRGRAAAAHGAPR
jgi:ribosomal protein S12 methylthiotransferase accessory factor